MSTRSGKILGRVGALGLAAAAFLLPARSDACCEPERAAPTAADTTATLDILGVDCAGCTVAIRRALKRLDGVKEVTFPSSLNRAVVSYDPAKVTPEQMVDAVNRTGFRATLAPDGKA